MQALAVENNLSETAFSAFTQLVAYWARRFSKTEFRVKQVSQLGGGLTCELMGDRVLISGRAVLFMRGVIEIDT